MPRLALTLLLFLAALAAPLAPAQAGPAALSCFVSIPPQAYFLERLGGDRVRALVLAPPGASPHTYEPTPKQVAALAQARAYFSIGLPFEKRLLPKARAGNPGLTIVDTTVGAVWRRMTPQEQAAEEAGHGHQPKGGGKQAHADHQQDDPHLWLSPRTAMLLAANMAQGLKALDPDHAELYEANLRGLLKDLEELDLRLAQALAPIKGREFLVYHPAFGYLGDAYGLKQVAVETGGKEPGPKGLAAVIDLARARGIRVVFVQPQFPLTSARQVAQAIGGVVVPLDPLARDYLVNLEHMAGQIAQALAGR